MIEPVAEPAQVMSESTPPASPMAYLQPGLVVTDLDVASRKRLFEELAELIATNYVLNDDCEDSSTPDMEEIFTTLHDRERLGCTAVGKGIALPHGRIEGLAEPVIAIARLSNPIDYDAPDRTPVWLAACLLVPADANEIHLNTLAALASRLDDSTFVERVRQSTSSEELYELFAQPG